MSIRIKFWGVRGSIPTPLTGTDLEKRLFTVLKQATAKDIKDDKAIRAFIRKLPFYQRDTIGGNTSCVEMATGKHTLIMDAGSGIKPLGNALMKRDFGTGNGHAHIFITHTHWDHIQGFPFFLPAFVPGNKITIYSSHPQIERRFRQQSSFEFFPVTFDQLGAEIEFKKVKPGEKIDLGHGACVSNIELNHPGKAYGYKVEYQNKQAVYGTDVEYTDMDKKDIARYIEFYKDSNVLISDSQYTLEETFNKKYWGHSSAMMGVEIALKAHIKTLVLFHHEPEYTDASIHDIQTQAESYMEYVPVKQRCKVVVGYEGLELKI